MEEVWRVQTTRFKIIGIQSYRVIRIVSNLTASFLRKSTMLPTSSFNYADLKLSSVTLPLVDDRVSKAIVHPAWVGRFEAPPHGSKEISSNEMVLLPNDINDINRSENTLVRAGEVDDGAQHHFKEVPRTRYDVTTSKPVLRELNEPLTDAQSWVFTLLTVNTRPD